MEEANLSFQVSVLRKALGDGAAQWIETVPKHGYRFTAEVKAVGPAGETPAASAKVANLPIPTEVRTNRTGATWLTAIGAALLIATVVYVAGFNRAPPTKPPAAAGFAIPLTSYPGTEGTPRLPTDLPLMGVLAWTPDGRWIVFSGRP